MARRELICMNWIKMDTSHVSRTVLDTWTNYPDEHS